MTTAAASVTAVTPAAYSPQSPFTRATMGTTVITGSDEHFAPANIAERFWEICERRDEVELRYE